MEITETMYWEEIERLAREALEAERIHGQDADDALYEAIDSHRWVMYPGLALQVPPFCRSPDEDLVDGADLSAVWRDKGLDGVASIIAFACILGDARKKLEEIYFEGEEEEEEEAV